MHRLLHALGPALLLVAPLAFMDAPGALRETTRYVTETEHWSDLTVTRPVMLMPGSTLVLTGDIVLAGSISVQEGAKLVLDRARVRAPSPDPEDGWSVTGMGDFVARGASLERGSVRMSGATSRENVVVDTKATAMYGMVFERGADVLVERSTFQGATGLSAFRGGLTISDASGEVRDSVFLNNSGWGIGVISTTYGQHVFGAARVVVAGNFVQGSTWGVHNQNSTTDRVTIANNVFHQNRQAINEQDNSDARVVANTFLDNVYALSNLGWSTNARMLGEPQRVGEWVVHAQGNYWGPGGPNHGDAGPNRFMGVVVTDGWLAEDPNAALTARWVR